MDAEEQKFYENMGLLIPNMVDHGKLARAAEVPSDKVLI
jgi:hypothetical protein